jgi:hypothetical protein
MPAKFRFPETFCGALIRRKSWSRPCDIPDEYDAGGGVDQSNESRHWRGKYIGRRLGDSPKGGNRNSLRTVK